MADEEQTKESSEEEDSASEEEQDEDSQPEGKGEGSKEEEDGEDSKKEQDAEDSEKEEEKGETKGSKEDSDQEDSDEEDKDEDSDDEEDKKDSEDLLLDHLIELHALEMQSMKLLEGAVELVGEDELEKFYKERLEQTQDHEGKVRDRIEARDTKSSPIKDLQQQQSAGIGLNYLAEDPSDKMVKFAMHTYALDSLKIATYECLMRIAKEAGDDETSDMAESALEEDKQALEDLTGTFDKVVELLSSDSESGDSDGSGDSDDSGDSNDSEGSGDSEDSGDSEGSSEGEQEERERSDEEEDSDEEDSEDSE